MDIISDTLGMEVFKATIAHNPLVETYSAFNNNGGILHLGTSMDDYEELANLMDI